MTMLLMILLIIMIILIMMIIMIIIIIIILMIMVSAEVAYVFRLPPPRPLSSRYAKKVLWLQCAHHITITKYYVLLLLVLL